MTVVKFNFNSAAATATAFGERKKNMCAISLRSDFIEGKRGGFADSSLTVPLVKITNVITAVTFRK